MNAEDTRAADVVQSDVGLSFFRVYGYRDLRGDPGPAGADSTVPGPVGPQGPVGPDADWTTLANKPAWVASTQSGVTLSSFSGNIDASRVTNLPSAPTADWATLANKPARVASTQGGVTLSSFSGNLDSSRITNLPSDGTADWTTLANKPA